MNLAQSLGMISPTQLAYAAGLVVLFAMHGRSFIAYILLADFIALLIIAGAMDMGWIVREPGNDQATAWMLVVYCLSFVVLVSVPGISQVVALFSAVAIPFFALTLWWGLPIGTTSAIVNALSLMQLAVAVIGMGDDSGNGHRRPRVVDPVPVQGADQGLGNAVHPARYQPISPNRGG